MTTSDISPSNKWKLLGRCQNCVGHPTQNRRGNQAFFLRHIAVNDATADNLIPQKILNSRIIFVL